MRTGRALITSVLCIVGTPLFAVATSAAGAREQKTGLKILYAGNPSSPRTADFAEFLNRHFASVQTVDLARLTEEQAGRFDVLVLDHDAERPPRPKFSDDYAVPTLTIGAAGASIGSTNGLKTGYL